jgi:hypothetical protein
LKSEFYDEKNQYENNQDLKKYENSIALWLNTTKQTSFVIRRRYLVYQKEQKKHKSF